MKHLEFEKRKQEKILRQQRERENNRTKRNINEKEYIEELKPFPLPTYDEYLKTKNDCSKVPNYAEFIQSKDQELKEFVKIREACNTFPNYTEYVNRFAKYALEDLEKRKIQGIQGVINKIEDPWKSQIQRVDRTNRSRRQVYSDFQAAGEFQYLENQSNNLLRHTTEVMCDIFNEQSEVLETLIRENPRRYIQKQLNHSAIKVKLVTDEVVQVTFCKSLEEEKIEFVDLSHFDGFKTSLALTQGQIPIKIKQFGDKIWYYKESVGGGGIISSDLQLHPVIGNVTNFKNFGEFNLNFLDNKVIFHEHILLDTKTNIEEELINEMREKADVSIQLHSNSQDGMIPHEILDDVDSFFQKYFIKIWRVYVTIGVTLFYIFIIRSFWMILSPKTFFDRKSRGFKRSEYKKGNEDQNFELREMPSRRSLIVD